jgi:hypothetical protein
MREKGNEEGGPGEGKEEKEEGKEIPIKEVEGKRSRCR